MVSLASGVTSDFLLLLGRIDTSFLSQGSPKLLALAGPSGQVGKAEMNLFPCLARLELHQAASSGDWQNRAEERRATRGVGRPDGPNPITVSL